MASLNQAIEFDSVKDSSAHLTLTVHIRRMRELRIRYRLVNLLLWCIARVLPGTLEVVELSETA